MDETATYRSPDGPIIGLFMMFLGFGLVTIPLWMSEDDFLGTRIRRGGGLFKLIEQTIGWTAFCGLLILLGSWFVSMGISSLWKLIDTRPDVQALEDRLEFHPAVRCDPATYDQVDYWMTHHSGGHPVLTIYFFEKYWSLESKWPSRSMTLEGGVEDLEDLVGFFDRNPQMAHRFRG